MAKMNSGISDISTTIDDIEKEAENNIIIGQKLQGYVQVFKKF